MPTSTYIPLANLTLSSTATSVTFSSISQSYRDLILVVQFYGSVDSQTYAPLRFNDDTSSTYESVYMSSDSSSPNSGTNSGVGRTSAVGARVNYPNATTIRYQIMDYSASDKHKSLLVRSDWDISRGAYAGAHRWPSTSAITKIEVLSLTNAYAAGSTFSLFGVAA